jgi:hypothetical protein
MTSIGLISQFDNDSDTGNIIFKDGNKFEFTLQDWKDRANAPIVGLKVSFTIHKGLIHIKMAEETDEISDSPDTSLLEPQLTGDPYELSQSNSDLKSIDDFIEHYTPKGFKVTHDINNGLARTISLRMFTASEFAQITVTQSDDKISASYELNGQSVPSI